jgi:hypothetical protein
MNDQRRFSLAQRMTIELWREMGPGLREMVLDAMWEQACLDQAAVPDGRPWRGHTFARYVATPDGPVQVPCEEADADMVIVRWTATVRDALEEALEATL